MDAQRNRWNDWMESISLPPRHTGSMVLPKHLFNGILPINIYGRALHIDPKLPKNTTQRQKKMRSTGSGFVSDRSCQVALLHGIIVCAYSLVLDASFHSWIQDSVWSARARLCVWQEGTKTKLAFCEHSINRFIWVLFAERTNMIHAAYGFAHRSPRETTKRPKVKKKKKIHNKKNVNSVNRPTPFFSRLY